MQHALRPSVSANFDERLDLQSCSPAAPRHVLRRLLPLSPPTTVASPSSAAERHLRRACQVRQVQRRQRSCRVAGPGGGGQWSGAAGGCGGGRQAELLTPQLEFLNEEGAQAEVWALSRILLDTLPQETGQLQYRGYRF